MMNADRVIRMAAVKTNSTDLPTIMDELDKAGIRYKQEVVLDVLYQVQQEKHGGMVSMVSALPDGSRRKILGWRQCTA